MLKSMGLKTSSLTTSRRVKRFAVVLVVAAVACAAAARWHLTRRPATVRELSFASNGPDFERDEAVVLKMGTNAVLPLLAGMPDVRKADTRFIKTQRWLAEHTHNLPISVPYPCSPWEGYLTGRDHLAALFVAGKPVTPILAAVAADPSRDKAMRYAASETLYYFTVKFPVITNRLNRVQPTNPAGPVK
jgi:hypothetical protein